MPSELEKRCDTFIETEEVQNHLNKRDFHNKLKEATEQGRGNQFLNDEWDLMMDHFGESIEQRDSMAHFFTRLFNQDNLTKKNQTEPVDLMCGDGIFSLAAQLISDIRSHAQNTLFEFSEQMEVNQSIQPSDQA